MRFPLLWALSCALVLPIVSAAQAPAEWQGRLADRMAGERKLKGQVMGQLAHPDVHADSILNHQFLRIHEKTSADAPNTERPYEAFWFLGYDSVSKRYVVHLLDVFGALYSETLGQGIREGDEIRFVFEYPDGPFHTTFRWNPEKLTWQWLMEQKDKNGKWASFADLKLTKVATP